MAEHVVSRTVRDSAAVLDAVAGPTPGEPYVAPERRAASRSWPRATRPPGRLRVALSVSAPNGEVVHADCVAAARAAAELCASLGHEVVEAAPAIDADAFTGHFINAWAAGNAWTMADWEERLAAPPPPTTSSR